MVQIFTSSGLSRLVHIDLHTAGQCIPVAQMGGGRLIFDEPVALPDTVGEVRMRIDGFPAGAPAVTKRWRVLLHAIGDPSREISANFQPIP